MKDLTHPTAGRINLRHYRKLALLAALVAVTPWVNAQRTVVAPRFFAPVHPAAHSVPQRTSLVSLHDHAAIQRSRGIFYPFGDWSGFYPGDDSNYPAGVQPSLMMFPAASVAGNQNQDEAPRPPADPLIIELQGDRYVRLTGTGDPQTSPTKSHALLTTIEDASNLEHPTAPNSNRRNTKSLAAATATPSQPPDLTPAILIFRDGHSEQVRDYTIADGMIYARGNFYTDGYWNKKIEIAALNVLQTVKSNEARGVTFLLPASPNQVITRP